MSTDFGHHKEVRLICCETDKKDVIIEWLQQTEGYDFLCEMTTQAAFHSRAKVEGGVIDKGTRCGISDFNEESVLVFGRS